MPVCSSAPTAAETQSSAVSPVPKEVMAVTATRLLKGAHEFFLLCTIAEIMYHIVNIP
jgi:hypothetical protein